MERKIKVGEINCSLEGFKIQTLGGVRNKERERERRKGHIARSTTLAQTTLADDKTNPLSTDFSQLPQNWNVFL